MMVPKTLLAAGVLLAVVGLTPGQAPPAKPAEKAGPEKAALDPAVEKLVNDLGHTDYHLRDEAARALEALGAKALPALRAAAKHADPEVRRRAEDMIPALQAAAYLTPRRINLAVEKKTVREVIQELSRASGYKVEHWGNNGDDQKLDFAWKDATFWQALDEVCRAGGLVVQQGYGDERVRLQGQDRYTPYVFHDGAFRVAANGFQANRSVDFSTLPRNRTDAPRADTLSFTFTVHSEPRLPILGIGEVKLTAAYDDQNTSLIPEPVKAEQPGGAMGGRTVRHYGGGRTTSHPAEAALGKPSPKATAVKLIKGTAPATVLVEQRPEVVTDDLARARGKKITVGTTQFVVEEVGENEAKQTQLKLSVTESALPANLQDHTWSNSLYYRLEVFDEKGQKMQNYSSGWSGSGSNHVQITFTYDPRRGNLGKPTKLVYSVWTTVQHQIPFEFKDLPLP
jgi:hypothetical protein